MMLSLSLNLTSLRVLFFGDLYLLPYNELLFKLPIEIGDAILLTSLTDGSGDYSTLKWVSFYYFSSVSKPFDLKGFSFLAYSSKLLDGFESL
jgi:hypothetical protein